MVIGPGDIDGDGIDDLVFSTLTVPSNVRLPVEHALYVCSGSVSGPYTTTMGTDSWPDDTWLLAAPGDVNGDGRADLLFGNSSEVVSTLSTPGTGVASLFLGTSNGTLMDAVPETIDFRLPPDGLGARRSALRLRSSRRQRAHRASRSLRRITRRWCS